MDNFERQQQAYERGTVAYATGKLRSDNPEPDELLRAAWWEGYDRAAELADEDDG